MIKKTHIFISIFTIIINLLAISNYKLKLKFFFKIYK